MSITKSKRCYLIYWDNSRIISRPNLKQYDFPVIETTVPSRLNDSSLRMIMRSIILAKSPLSLIDKINCSKSFQSGEPIFRRTTTGLTCSILRLDLKSQLVEDFRIESHSEGYDIATWTEYRKVRYEDDNEIEIMPKRRRQYDSRINKLKTINLKNG